MPSSDNGIYTSQELREKYPFLMKYFEEGIKNTEKNIAHCILFYGSDLNAQYSLALETARMQNCTGTKTPDCECLNCKWLRENKHPAVQTVTRWDSKSVNKEAKCVSIAIDIARKIKNDLLVNSDYHRVIIFCDKDKEEDGSICGLNRFNFQDDAANSLLKTFEEPPHNTTFFFLTKDKDDLISTVVSRAQAFYVPAVSGNCSDTSLVSDAMSGYIELERSEVLDFSDKITALAKEHDPSEVFTQMQNYIVFLMKANSENKLLKIKLIEDFKAIEKAKKENILKMNIQTVVENLAFSMILR